MTGVREPGAYGRAPSEFTMVTTDRAPDCVPGSGVVDATCPLGVVVEYAFTTFKLNPAAEMAAAAVGVYAPITSGTVASVSWQGNRSSLELFLITTGTQ